MRIHDLFDAKALERVAAAVKAAESGTSGEIVPVVVEASDGYEEAHWRAAAAFGAAVLLAELGYHVFVPVWLPLAPGAAAAGALLAGAAGALVVHLAAPARRLFAGADRMAERVHQAARTAFLREKVFATRDRTGILVFVSLLERRVVVLADEGIHARTSPGTWDGVVAKVVDGMRRGAPADGLAEAVRLCGEKVREAGFAARPDDVNELSDAPRIGSAP